jgi:hypothetical protein
MKKSLLLMISICGLWLINGCGSTTTKFHQVATHFSVMPASNAQIAGTAFNFTVTALDSSNAAVGAYAGTVHFTSTDVRAALPADTTMTNGMGSFSATLKTAGNQTITATATISGISSSLTVSAAPASQLAVSAPATATARVTFSFTVSALDAYNNTATSYSGTVHFASSDTKAVLPANSPLPNGVGNFSATTESTGNQNITATDTVSVSLTGKSSTIATTTPPALMITSGAPPNGTVDQIYGGLRRRYEACATSGCFACTRPAPPLPGTCPAWPPCGSRPCILELDLTGFTLSAAGGVPPYGWSASALPLGLRLTNEDVEFDISGTPPSGTTGTYKNVLVTLNDSGTPQAQTPATYTILVSNPPPPVVNSTPAPPAGAVNLPYTYNFTASSGTLPLQNWNETGALPPGLSPLTAGGLLSGTPTSTGSFPISVTVQDAAGQSSAPQGFALSIYQHGFAPTGSMTTLRTGYAQTLLRNGKVLVTGGWVPGTGPLATAELFDAATGTFAATASMGTARSGHTATLLNDGRVLVAGGTDSNVIFATAEIYDPTTGKFTPTGSMGTASDGHTATLLNNNKVLIVGGSLAIAELYDPVAGTFAATGGLTTLRESYAINLLANGKVLVAGGVDASSSPLATAEIYDPVAGTFAATGSMTSKRLGPTATLLNSSKVLVAGGTDASGNPVAAAELYDPVAGTFAVTGSMVTARIHHTATLLNDGTVLFAGGDILIGNTFNGASTAELFDPTTGTFLHTGSMGANRTYHLATLLNDGRVLVTGGFTVTQTSLGYTATAELYQ